VFDNHTKLVRRAAVALSLAVLIGCNPQAVRKGENGQQETGRVLAVVNGSALTTDDFEKEVETLPVDLKPMAHTAEGKEELLDTMIVRELIMQEAIKDNTGRSRAAVDKLDGLKKRILVDEYLQKKIKEQNKASVAPAKPQKVLQEIKEELKKSARIIIPEEDGVDAGDENNLNPQQLKLLRHLLDRDLTGDDVHPR